MLRLLVVDDSTLLHMNLSDQAEFHGIGVVFADSVTQAILRMRQETEALSYDAVLLDHRLRGEERGTAFAEWLQDNSPAMRVFLIGSLMEPGYPPEYEYIGKCFRTDILIRALEKGCSYFEAEYA